MHQGVPADPQGPREPARPDPEPDVGRLLGPDLRRAVLGVLGHAGIVYLPSADGRSLVMTALAGLPPAVVTGFERVPVTSRMPVSEVYRTGRSVYVTDNEERMRRFPRAAVGVPYDYASASVPITDDGHTMGVLVVMWPGTGEGVPPGSRRHLRVAAHRLAAGLTRLGAPARPAIAEGPLALVPLTETPERPPGVGLFDWDPADGALSGDEEFHALLGPSHEPLLDVLSEGTPLARTLRLTDDTGAQRTVGLTARAAPGGHVLGALVDTAATSAAVGAVERLRDGVFGLDMDGRVSLANRSLELLLDIRRPELLGRRLWDALGWLGEAGSEESWRAAVFSMTPTAFLARRPSGQWLAFALYPDSAGVTGRVTPASAPGELRVSLPEAPPAVRTGPGPTYHLLHLASALTEAASVREVCEAVADQILPAFGGQELAVYHVRDGRMYLVEQRGYPDGFLDRFEGTPIAERLPGAETVVMGVPIFFESEHELRAAYPGIPQDEMGAWAFLPLIASGRPVGSCILGFDTPRVFTTEERSVLTGLGGLIAQALERARLYDAEFALARGLQQALLPHRLPSVPGLEIAARYLPGTRGMEIGGDWYDVVLAASGVCLVIGDVEGHSVGAAAVMGQLRSAVRAFAASGAPPGEILARTNQLLVDLDPGLLASSLLLRIDPAAGRVEAARAGHVPPLLRRPGGGSEVLDLPGGLLLGVDRDAAYPVTELLLPPGGVLALYTDGLVEGGDLPIAQGIDRLRTVLAHGGAGSLEVLADRLVQAARRSAIRADDVALLLAARV